MPTACKFIKVAFSNSNIFDLTKCTGSRCFRSGRLIQVPIKYESDVIGTLASCVSHTANDRLARSALKITGSMIASNTINYIEFGPRQPKSDELDGHRKLVETINERLASTLESKEITKIILEHLGAMFKAGAISIMLLDQQKQRLGIIASRGLRRHPLKDKKIPVAKCLCGRAIRTGQPLFLANEGDAPELAPEPSDGTQSAESRDSASFISMPLTLRLPNEKDRVIGLINISGQPAGPFFTRNDLKVLEAITLVCAPSIYHSRLLKKIRHPRQLAENAVSAGALQFRTFPKLATSRKDLDLAGRTLLAQDSGGDMFDQFVQRNGQLHMVMSDVPGYIRPAQALLDAMRSQIRSVSRNEEKPGDVLTTINRLLYDDVNRADLLPSIFYSTYDPANRIMRYANGGTSRSLLYRFDDDATLSLNTHGARLGTLEDFAYPQQQIGLKSNDVIVLYSDGLVEALNGAGNPFGQDRLATVLKNFSYQNSSQILAQIFRSIRDHIGYATQMDDITVARHESALKIQDLRRSRMALKIRMRLFNFDPHTPFRYILPKPGKVVRS